MRCPLNAGYTVTYTRNPKYSASTLWQGALPLEVACRTSSYLSNIKEISHISLQKNHSSDPSNRTAGFTTYMLRFPMVYMPRLALAGSRYTGYEHSLLALKVASLAAQPIASHGCKVFIVQTWV